MTSPRKDGRLEAVGGAGGERRPAHPPEVDVLVIGGGPAGSAAATVLARGGLTVTVVEREVFPRFRVGESLVPNCMPVLERLGVLDKITVHGFQDKFGATFNDQETGLTATFRFREGRPWPAYTYDVHRAEFDHILLDHAAAQPGVTLLQPATVEAVSLDAEGVTARVRDGAGPRDLRARFLVDASGREAFLGMRHGERRPMPGLGKVAIYAYFRGARRWPGREEGNVRIYIFPEGWFWWIPLARDETSVGCVLHARTVKARKGSPAELFAEMIERCTAVRDGLVGAERVTPILTAANFSYAVEPVIGDRFLCVGDAVAFVDPIFSAGVFLALVSGEQAGHEILAAFRDGRFRAQRFRGYQRRLERGMRPFTHFIREFYDRGFLRVFLQPQDTLGLPIVDAVTFVLAGGTFSKVPLKMRLSLWIFYRVVRMTRKVLRRRGESAESRLDW